VSLSYLNQLVRT